MTHPGVDAVRTMLADSGLDALSIVEQRAAMATAVGAAPPPEGVAVTTLALGTRPAEWLVPDGVGGRGPGEGEAAAVLYLHGGGYCIGSLDTHRQLAARIAVEAGCAVATLDYRLAPEHRFPAALDDAVAAYRDLTDGSIAPGRVAIAGDSAGGGLTVATLLALRAQGLALPGAAVCLSPWVDLTQSAPSFGTQADADPLVTKAGLDIMAAAYLGDTDPRTALASPVFAEDLRGLPPTMIEVGEHEVLVDDALGLRDRLSDAGVSVSLTVWPEMVHVFQAFPASIFPESDRSVAAVGSFLRHYLAGRGADQS